MESKSALFHADVEQEKSQHLDFGVNDDKSFLNRFGGLFDSKVKNLTNQVFN